ncbi:MAG: hypothetical protein CL710_01980 [Chloroflexi bacterium]|nr:hypothetical protein [Chloroflexota bacterium]|tara:strand:- start:3097 stop:4362 length:1266 start_codon:yes stop_codon:yes gene_type:complete
MNETQHTLNTDSSEPTSFLKIISNKQFRLLWLIGGFASCMRWLDMLILGVYTFEITNSAFLVGLIFFYRQIPRLIFGTFIGIISDRFNRKYILFLTFAILWIIYAVIAYLIHVDKINYTMLAITMFLAGICWAHEFPVRRAMIGDVIPNNIAGKAFGIDIGTSAFTRIIGPALGGAILSFLGPVSGYLTVAISFLIVSILCLGVKGSNQNIYKTEHSKKILGFINDTKEAISYIKNNNLLQATIMVTFAMNLFAFPYFNMVPVVGKEILQANPFQVGLMGAIEGTGALIGASVIATKVNYNNYARVYFFGSLFLTLCIFLFANSSIYLLSMAILFTAGFGMVSFATMQTTLTIVSSDPEIRGRTMGALSIAIGAGPLGSLLIGILASQFGTQNGIMIIAALCFTSMLIIGYYWPVIRKSTE